MESLATACRPAMKDCWCRCNQIGAETQGLNPIMACHLMSRQMPRQRRLIASCCFKCLVICLVNDTQSVGYKTTACVSPPKYPRTPKFHVRLPVSTVSKNKICHQQVASGNDLWMMRQCVRRTFFETNLGAVTAYFWSCRLNHHDHMCTQTS